MSAQIPKMTPRQRVLAACEHKPFGTPEQVEQQVKERVATFSRKNGFIFSAVHNIQCNTPIENVLAMFRALGRI